LGLSQAGCDSEKGNANMSEKKTYFVAARLTETQMVRLRTKALTVNGNISEALRRSVMDADICGKNRRQSGIQLTQGGE
jgi:hypothetical protein